MLSCGMPSNFRRRDKTYQLQPVLHSKPEFELFAKPEIICTLAGSRGRLSRRKIPLRDRQGHRGYLSFKSSKKHFAFGTKVLIDTAARTVKYTGYTPLYSLIGYLCQKQVLQSMCLRLA